MKKFEIIDLDIIGSYREADRDATVFICGDGTAYRINTSRARVQAQREPDYTADYDE